MFTKGKWEIGYKGWRETPVVIVPDLVPIVIALLGQDGRIPDDETKANAQLIASSPRLLNALEQITCEIFYLEGTRLDETQEHYVAEIKKLALEALEGLDL